MEKLTKMQKFEMVLNYVESDEMLVDFIKHEMELIKNKNHGNRGLTQTQKLNIELKEKILNFMQENVRYSATEIYNKLDLSSQSKATSLLTALKNENKVVRIEEKRKVFFIKA